MANPFRKNQVGGSNENPAVKVLTAKNFFGKGSSFYDEKQEFLAWGELSRDEDIAQVQKFIFIVKTGLRIINTSTEKRDVGGVPYKFLTYLKPNADRDGVKLVLTGPWGRILEDYQNRLIKIDFTLDELIEEARK